MFSQKLYIFKYNRQNEQPVSTLYEVRNVVCYFSTESRLDENGAKKKTGKLVAYIPLESSRCYDVTYNRHPDETNVLRYIDVYAYARLGASDIKSFYTIDFSDFITTEASDGTATYNTRSSNRYKVTSIKTYDLGGLPHLKIEAE